MKFPTYRILLFLLLLLIAHSLYAQKKNQIIVEQRDFSNFTQIIAKGVSNVYLSQGNTFEVRVEAPEEMIDKIVIAQTGNQLLITTDDTQQIFQKTFVGTSKITKSKVFITLPSLELLEIAGAADVYSLGTFTEKNIQFILRNAGDLKFDLDAQEVSCKINGAGDARLSGNAHKLLAQVSGAGDLKAYNLNVKEAQIKVSGAGDALVFVTDNLKADVSGSADLRYKGNPQITDFSVSGVGDIHQGK